MAVVSPKHFLGAVTGLHPETVTQRPFENAERRTAILCVGAASASEDEAAPLKPVRARVKPLGQAER